MLSRPGGLAYYDTATNLTWVADANLAQNGGLGYLGTKDCRLPTVTDTGTPGCNFAHTGTDCGYNVDLATGEVARRYRPRYPCPGWCGFSVARWCCQARCGA